MIVTAFLSLQVRILSTAQPRVHHMYVSMLVCMGVVCFSFSIMSVNTLQQ